MLDNCNCEKGRPLSTSSCQCQRSIVRQFIFTLCLDFYYVPVRVSSIAASLFRAFIISISSDREWKFVSSFSYIDFSLEPIDLRNRSCDVSLVKFYKLTLRVDKLFYMVVATNLSSDKVARVILQMTRNVQFLFNCSADELSHWSCRIL